MGNKVASDNSELCRRIQNGDMEAGDILIRNNSCVINKIAGKMYNKSKRLGVQFYDLQQEASIGMLKAAMRYRDDMNADFLTYADYWMKHDGWKEVRKEFQWSTHRLMEETLDHYKYPFVSQEEMCINVKEHA